MCKDIIVGIADYNVVREPNKLITIGLGSCIGIALYDNVKRIGGLVHIMLPESTKFNNVLNPLKFADLALPLLIDEMKKHNASISNMSAKIAGGASMFNFSDKRLMLDIGNRNSIAVKETLKSFLIPITGEDVGGNKGRTMILDSSTGNVIIKTVGMEIKHI